MATIGFEGCAGVDSVVRGFGLRAFNLGAVGGLGAEDAGGFGGVLLEISGSEA